MLLGAEGRFANTVSRWPGVPVQHRDGSSSGTIWLGRGHRFRGMLITWL